jgi:RimJ/RimL family protein N-acetyltransferase
VTPPVELMQVSAATLRALADGNLVAANRTAPVPLTPYLAGPECRGVWGVRAVQVVEDPASAPWVTRVVWNPERRIAVGSAGYHGPPDGNGMVEVGYSIDPQYRRQGYARAALLALLERAEREPGGTTVRATIAPGNVASRDLVLSHGFVEVGEQMDEEDGLEIVYEVTVGSGVPSIHRR